METRTRRNLFLIALCALSFVLLACRVQSLLQAEATSTPPRTRAALRPTFTPRPAESATPIASTDVPTERLNTETLTPELIPTESFTPVPPPAEPTDTRAPTQRPTQRATIRPTATRTRPRPTNTSLPRPSNTPQPSNTPLPQPTPTPTPTVKTQYAASGKSCTAAANATSDTVTGTITENGAAAPNKHVRGSAGPGGEPIGTDVNTDSQGHYTVTFACGGAACDGDFWVWMVTFDGKAVSPYVKFSFGTSCRRGVVNFSK